MKATHQLSLMGAILCTMQLASCTSMSEVAERYPHPSNLVNTECITKDMTYASDSRAIEGGSTFEMVLDGTKAKCSFLSLDYPCDFEKVNVNVGYKDGILSIVEFPSYDSSECRCDVDASFTILDMPQEDFILKLYHGDTTGNYYADAPKHSCQVTTGTRSKSIPYQSAGEEVSKCPYVSRLSNTECKEYSSVPQVRSTRSEEGEKTSFEMIFEGSMAQCKFTTLHYFCDFGRVNIRLEYKDNELIIVEYPSGNMADCYCDVDASFTIMNIPEKEFMLRIYHGNVNGDYNEAYPTFYGMVDPEAGSIKIFYPY